MLDLTTLYVMVALSSIVAGIVHVVPWATGRFGRWSAWWGIGHIILGTTAVAAVLRDYGAPDWIVRVANPLALTSYAAIYCGMRSFVHPRARNLPIMLVACLIAVPLLSSVDRAAFPMRVAYLSVVRSLFDIATVALAVQIARRERLHTGWIVATMFGVTVPMFLTRGWLAFNDQIGAQLTGRHGDPAAWLAAGQIAFILFRGFSLFVLEAERGQNALAELAERDPLTGAFNRTGFDRRRPAWRGDGAVLVLDLDRFKQLNDTCGHAVGDSALRILAGVTRDVLAPHGTVFRWGGDEFVGVLPGASPDSARAVAAGIMIRFQGAVASIVPAGIAVAPSIGIACGALTDTAALLAQADAAMYAAKAQRRSGQRSVAENDPSVDLISRLQHG